MPPSLESAFLYGPVCDLGFASMDNVWMASDFDGAFAQFVTVPQTEVFLVDCDWSDAELATIPCAYATAETMLHRAGCGPRSMFS